MVGHLISKFDSNFYRVLRLWGFFPSLYFNEEYKTHTNSSILCIRTIMMKPDAAGMVFSLQTTS